MISHRPPLLWTRGRRVMAEANVRERHAHALLRRLRAAAVRRPGGSWMRYTWRSTPLEPIHIKGAHVSKLCLEHPKRDALAVLCYGVLDAAPPAAGRLPTPPPVAPSRAGVKAAALALAKRLARAGGAADVKAAVGDADGTLGLAAAEALGWELCELPETLKGVQLAQF